MSLRLLMMGTGSFAVPTFERLCESPHHIVGLVTQPDRTGRGHHHHINPMKQAAELRGIPVWQPESPNHPDALKQWRDAAADLFVVAAYGRILSAELLSIPPLGAVNVHASLLPRYRGAAPIAHAILHGETETGVSVFRIEPQLDAGPVLGTVRTSIGPKETAGELEARLAQLAPEITLEVINQLEAGTTRPLAQDPALATNAPRLRKEQGAIDWSRPSAEVSRHVRAMQPWPKPYTFLHVAGHPPLRMLILDVDPVERGSPAPPPGTIIAPDQSGDLIVCTGDGAVRINRLQPAGKRAMSAAEFLRGHAVRPGDRFGGEGAIE